VIPGDSWQEVSERGVDQRAGLAVGPFRDAKPTPPSAVRSAALAQKLLAQTTSELEAEWKQGSFDDWGMEASNIALTAVKETRRFPRTRGRQGRVSANRHRKVSAFVKGFG
jgi:hypothetical protein